MIIWLDHKLFGNGYGTGSPFWDQRYYWLVDTNQRERHGRNGQLYHWIGGLGAQLYSFEWRHPKPGITRQLAGLTFRPFNSSRRGPRVHVSWATTLPRDIDEANSFLRDLKARLGQS